MTVSNSNLIHIYFTPQYQHGMTEPACPEQIESHTSTKQPEPEVITDALSTKTPTAGSITLSICLKDGRMMCSLCLWRS